MTSGPTAGAIVEIDECLELAAGTARHKDDLRARLARARERAADERRHAAGGDADDDVAAARCAAGRSRAALLVVVLDAFLRVEHGFLAAGHDGLHDLGRQCRRWAASRPPRRTPSRPLVPAPTKIDAPALAQRLRHDLDAVRDPLLLAVHGRDTLRSSLTISSMMSATGALSRLRLAGLMASVGRDCHFELLGIRGSPGTKRSRGYYSSPGA